MATRKPSAAASSRRADEMDAAKAKALRRKRSLRQWIITLSAVVVIGVIVAVVTVTSRNAAVVVQPSGEARVTVAGQSDVPFDVSEGRVRIGAPDAAVTLALYEDFSCLHCQRYEAEVGDTLSELVASGEVAVEYHPMRVATDYGNRAGSAATCVAVGDPGAWPEVHSALFALHDETTNGWSNEQLRDHLSAEQGITDESVLECIASGRYETWVDQNTQRAVDAGISETPTLRVNGEKSEALDVASLRTAVEAALDGQ